MDMRKCVVMVAVMLACYGLAAQPTKLYVPTNVQRAIEHGTRTMSGVPGSAYFQNSSTYQIKATFDPATAKLEGTETVTYHNASPDTLKYLVIRLYPNIFQPGMFRQTEVDSADINRGVTISQMKINGVVVPASKFHYGGTNLIVLLPSALEPTSSLKMEVSWDVTLPNKTQMRMGRYDSTSYFVAYWYPQIAVYDDVNGWSRESYTGLAEFYNDFNNYDVEVNLPAGYVAWATGVLQNQSTLFTDKILGRIAQAQASDSVVSIITANDYRDGDVLRSKGENTWHFKADNVTDFAFGTTTHYVWDGTSVEVDSATGRRAMANAVYKVGSIEGRGIAAIARHTLLRLSTDLIGVPYPYPHNTIWEGNSGMEFPMMCNDGPVENTLEKVFVTSHEVSHSYFPFMVGTNETLYGWVDEGLVTFIPKAIEQEAGNKNAHYYIAAYGRRVMGSSNDVPLSVPTTQLSESTYFVQNYGRAAAGFYFLNDMLGKETFRKVMQEFIHRWAGKHPTPTDLALTFNAVAGEDLAWFWNPWFYQYGYADLALSNVSVKGGDLSLTVQKRGSFPVPVKLTITFDDGATTSIYKTAAVWKDGDAWTFKQKFEKPVTKVVLGDRDIPDAFPENNSITLK